MLTGRSVLNGAYTTETGVKKENIEEKILLFYKTLNPNVLRLFKYDYILISPKERGSYGLGERKTPNLKEVYSFSDASWGTYSIFIPIISSDNRYINTNYNYYLRGLSKVYLSDLDPLSQSQDFGFLLNDNGIEQSNISLFNKEYIRGIATHANSQIVYRLNSGYTAFHAFIGVDSGQVCTNGSVVFHVYTNGENIFTSPIMVVSSQPIELNLPVQGKNVLTLEVTDAGDGITCDHASWADAYLQ
jgi:hypothetical protein